MLGEKDFQTDEPIGWAQFLNKESVSKFILGQDKQDDKQGYIQLYLELILNESKKKVDLILTLNIFNFSFELGFVNYLRIIAFVNYF